MKLEGNYQDTEHVGLQMSHKRNIFDLFQSGKEANIEQCDLDIKYRFKIYG